jgi:hypothetical protein
MLSCVALQDSPQITGDGNLQTLPGILAVGFPPVRKKPLSLSLSLSLASSHACLAWLCSSLQLLRCVRREEGRVGEGERQEVTLRASGAASQNVNKCRVATLPHPLVAANPVANEKRRTPAEAGERFREGNN